jgi:hypothetical protein
MTWFKPIQNLSAFNHLLKEKKEGRKKERREGGRREGRKNRKNKEKERKTNQCLTFLPKKVGLIQHFYISQYCWIMNIWNAILVWHDVILPLFCVYQETCSYRLKGHWKIFIKPTAITMMKHIVYWSPMKRRKNWSSIWATVSSP